MSYYNRNYREEYSQQRSFHCGDQNRSGEMRNTRPPDNPGWRGNGRRGGQRSNYDADYSECWDYDPDDPAHAGFRSGSMHQNRRNFQSNNYRGNSSQNMNYQPRARGRRRRGNEYGGYANNSYPTDSRDNVYDPRGISFSQRRGRGNRGGNQYSNNRYSENRYPNPDPVPDGPREPERDPYSNEIIVKPTRQQPEPREERGPQRDYYANSAFSRLQDERRDPYQRDCYGNSEFSRRHDERRQPPPQHQPQRGNSGYNNSRGYDQRREYTAQNGQQQFRNSHNRTQQNRPRNDNNSGDSRASGGGNRGGGPAKKYRPNMSAANNYGYGTSPYSDDADELRRMWREMDRAQFGEDYEEEIDVSIDFPSSSTNRNGHSSGFESSLVDDSLDEILSNSDLNCTMDNSSVASLAHSLDAAVITDSQKSSTDVNSPGWQASSRSPFPVPQNVEQHAVMVAPKKAPAIRDKKTKIEKLQANIFTLEVQHKTVYRYDVCIRLKREAGRQDVDLTKGARDDAAVTERHELCVAALRRALEVYRILNEGNAIAHDGSAILFSSEDLQAALKPHSSTLSLSVTDLPSSVREYIRSADVSSLEIEIVPCREGASQLDIADFDKAQNNRDMAHLDRSWKQFHEMLTNQDAIANGRFTLYGAGKLFSQNAQRKAVGFGHELIQGGDKGVKFIEGRNAGPSRAVAALVLDAKVGQFFKAQNLVLSIEELLYGINRGDVVTSRRFPFEKNARNFMNDTWAQVNKYVKGLRLNYVNSVSHLNSSFVAVGISKLPVEKITEIGIEGNSQPLLARFSDVNPRDLRLNWPAVVFRSNLGGKSREIHYPMELLSVAPHQRVSLQKQVAPPARAVKPYERYGNISDIMNALNLDQGGSRNEYLRAFGITVADRPYEVKGIRREAPSIQYSQNSGRGKKSSMARTDEQKGNWRMDRNDGYVDAGGADLVVIAYTCEKRVADDASIAIQRLMKSRGMKVANWELAPISRNSWKDELTKLFEQVKKAGGRKKCIVFIDALDNKSHGWLKIMERRHLIVTQQLTRELAQKIPRQSNSCSNFVNKLNCKLTGLNHCVVPDEYGRNRWISKAKTLIIGYDVAHPGKADRDEIMRKMPPQNPSVVGLSFNGAPHPESFIGDFHYQTPRMEQVSSDVLNTRMKWMLKLFIKNRKCWPESIFIVRDGISEGQYRMAIDNELAALREACEEYGNMNEKPGWHPKFLMLVVTKRHSVRLFKEGQRGVENPLPCTVVDTDIVRNDMTEFFMQPHRVIQGTGKSPSYQVLVDDIGMSSDEIQATMLALAFSHQIVESPISLPEPVYQADEWAKRGNEMWKTFNDNFTLPQCKDAGDYCMPPIDFERMTNNLAYWNTPLEESRVNA